MTTKQKIRTQILCIIYTESNVGHANKLCFVIKQAVPLSKLLGLNYAVMKLHQSALGYLCYNWQFSIRHSHRRRKGKTFLKMTILSQQNSYFISQLLGSVTTRWLGSDSAVTLGNCRQQGDCAANASVVSPCYRQLTAVTILFTVQSPCGHCAA